MGEDDLGCRDRREAARTSAPGLGDGRREGRKGSSAPEESELALWVKVEHAYRYSGEDSSVTKAYDCCWRDGEDDMAEGEEEGLEPRSPEALAAGRMWVYATRWLPKGGRASEREMKDLRAVSEKGSCGAERGRRWGHGAKRGKPEASLESLLLMRAITISTTKIFSR
jgi:hypothetical protein